MRFTYDPRHNIANIRLREKRGEVESIRASDELTVDLPLDDTIYDIELLPSQPTKGKASNEP
jgi:uncharacterized protein YuzE